MLTGKENLSFITELQWKLQVFLNKTSNLGLYAWLKMVLQISVFYLSLQSQLTLAFQV